MDVGFDAAVAGLLAGRGASAVPSQEAIEKEKKFREVLKELEAMQETPAERARRKAQEAKEAKAKRDREKRVNDLRNQIAALRTRLMSGGSPDAGIAARISMLETELYWALYSL